MICINKMFNHCKNIASCTQLELNQILETEQV